MAPIYLQKIKITIYPSLPTHSPLFKRRTRIITSMMTNSQVVVKVIMSKSSNIGLVRMMKLYNERRVFIQFLLRTLSY